MGIAAAVPEVRAAAPMAAAVKSASFSFMNSTSFRERKTCLKPDGCCILRGEKHLIYLNARSAVAIAVALSSSPELRGDIIRDVATIPRLY
jgi:hypothetical protein